MTAEAAAVTAAATAAVEETVVAAVALRDTGRSQCVESE